MWNAFGVGSYFVILCEMFGCCRSQYIDAALNIEHCLFLCVCFASHLKRPQNLFSLMIFYFYVNFSSNKKKKKETITDNSHISDEYLFVSHMWGAVFDSFARTQTKYTGWQLNIHPFQKRNIMKRQRKKNNQKERLWQLIDQNRNIFCKYQIHLWLFILQIFIFERKKMFT